ncbi:hypothetical protein Q5P01_000761 [Channa striata]|uniref:Cyclodeaminase/cyclohydrolase domain-containing protein n=1 Tax=Channa striata TaxID=64152 RepID=A0AA88IDV4_CHASR|nr:hypothetical protein Q5P01_000761 [Channa striata]
MQEGLQRAVGVPLSLAERVGVVWSPLKETVAYGNVGCKSDAQVAAKALETAMFGAYYDITVNLKDVADVAFRRASQKRVTAPLQEAKDRAAVVLNAADKTN